MLTINDKIAIFEELLLENNGSYADDIKEEIYNYFFIYTGTKKDVKNFSFLNDIDTADLIKEKVDYLVSKIIMHEHQGGLEDLIINYIA